MKNNYFDSNIKLIDNPTISFKIKSDFRNIRYLCASIVGICHDKFMKSTKVDNIELYISEVSNNIIQHSYLEDKEREIEAFYITCADGMQIDIYDQGNPIPDYIWKQESLLPENTVKKKIESSGRGLYLITTLTDGFCYFRNKDNNIHSCYQRFN